MERLCGTEEKTHHGLQVFLSILKAHNISYWPFKAGRGKLKGQIIEQ